MKSEYEIIKLKNCEELFNILVLKTFEGCKIIQRDSPKNWLVGYLITYDNGINIAYMTSLTSIKQRCSKSYYFNTTEKRQKLPGYIDISNSYFIELNNRLIVENIMTS